MYGDNKSNKDVKSQTERIQHFSIRLSSRLSVGTLLKPTHKLHGPDSAVSYQLYEKPFELLSLQSGR